jgi:hypothetical protein
MKNKRKNKISDEEEKPVAKIPKLRKSVRSVLSENPRVYVDDEF